MKQYVVSDSNIGEWQHFMSDAKIVFIKISNDEFLQNPMTDCDGNGRICSFNSSHCNYFDPDRLGELFDEYGKKNVFPLSYYEHGQCLWDVQGGEHIGGCPDMQFDGVSFAGVWIANKDVLDNIGNLKGKARKKKLLEYAKGVCKEYTAWCNGEGYQFQVKAFNLKKDEDGEEITDIDDYDDEPLEEDSCCGFLGYESIDYMIADYLDPLIAKHLTASEFAI